MSAEDITAVVTIQIPEAAQPAYSDAVLRAALMSLSVRATVPAEEQLSLLPFQVQRARRLQGRRRDRGPRRHAHRRRRRSAGDRGMDTHILVATAAGGASQAGRSRTNCPRGVRNRAEHERRPHQLVEVAAHRRQAGPPDHGARHATARPATRSRSCSGCASAAAPICTWSGWRARTAGRRPMPAFGRCATGLS